MGMSVCQRRGCLLQGSEDFLEKRRGHSLYTPDPKNRLTG